VLTVILVSLVFSTSDSALPARNGDILFISLRVRNGHERLYRMRPDGTHQRPIARAPGNVAEPTWSPDGKWIAYRTAEEYKKTCTQLYVMRADGTRARRLTHDGACYGAPAWSPDGKRLAFERGGQGSIWTMNVDGTRLQRLTHPKSYFFDMSPAWSPDGTTIAFIRVVGDPNAIWLIDADGSNERQLTKPSVQNAGDSWPDWSPDGHWIAFSRLDDPTEGRGGTRWRRDIWLVRPDGAALRKLTRHAGANDWPAWSPNGRRIVFGSDRKHSDLMDIYVMNADGRRQERLTKGTIDNSSPDWGRRP
jgi:TolB protein